MYPVRAGSQGNGPKRGKPISCLGVVTESFLVFTVAQTGFITRVIDWALAVVPAKTGLAAPAVDPGAAGPGLGRTT